MSELEGINNNKSRYVIEYFDKNSFLKSFILKQGQAFAAYSL